MTNPLDTVTETIIKDLDPDRAMQTKAEAQIAARILIGVALVAVVVGVATFIWGLPALTMAALAATVLVLGLLVAYAAGF